MKLLRSLLGVGLMAGTTFAQTVSNLYSFVGYPSDGQNPQAGLVQGSDGNFYGTTIIGGVNYYGTVFRINPAGSYSNLYNFGAASDGQRPTGLVQGSDGNFYGTTEHGGVNTFGPVTCGTVYRISPTGSYANLYSFGGPPDGHIPFGGLVQGSDGNFYGTTGEGGDAGTVFRISPTGSYSNLYSFSAAPDGNIPVAKLVQGSDGNFYGTTLLGGANYVGTVFRISATGSYSNLYSFGAAPDGNTPYAGLVQGSDGNFYGTTVVGGVTNFGTVYRISPTGSYSNLYSFVGSPSDGRNPYGGLVQGSDGNFYGTCIYGGANSFGTLYRISPTGSYSNLYSFGASPDGANPYGGLVQGCDGNFYGTCYYGGANSFGTVFRLTMPLSPAPNQISRIQVAGSNVSVTVPSVAGETYQLQSRLSLTTGSWSNVPGATVVNSIGSALTLTNLGGAVPAQAFYRMWIRIGGIPVSAWDTAAEDAYSGGWTTGSNGGYGFNPWTLTGIGSHFGYFIGSSTNNAGVSQPGIDTSGMSWSAFADGDSYTAAYRTFAAGSLAVGQSLLLNLDNGYIDNGQTVGFALRTGNASSGPDDYNVGARFEFFFLGGRANYQVADTAVHDLGTGYTGTGKRLVFTLTTADAYTLLTIDNANGTTNTFSGTLGGTLGTTVDSIAIYNRNAGNGPNFDAYFNSLQITGP